MFDEQDIKYLQDMEKRIVEQSAANMRVILESSINPQLSLIAEGQSSLLAKLAPRSEVEKLKEEVEFLKAIVKANTREIEALKKAQ